MKIKQVEIAGFRAYKTREDGTFNFQMPNGDTANFVAIYAPNGFGKSSFYDAVEWAITNNIHRLTRDSLVSNNNKISLSLNSAEGGQRILRNRDISENDDSSVRVVTTLNANCPFERRVRRAGARQRDFSFDQNATENKELSSLFLSQDAIDAFLKEVLPERRYDEFMSHFGGDEDQYRQKLVVLRKEAVQQLNKLSDEINTLESTLKSDTNIRAFDSVNETITQLQQLGENIGILDLTRITPSIHLFYQNWLAKQKNVNAQEIDLVQSKLLLSQESQELWPAYQENLSQEKRLARQIDELNHNLEQLAQRNKLLNHKGEYETTLSSKIEELSNLTQLSVGLSSYLSKDRQLVQYQAEQKRLQAERDAAEINLSVNQQQNLSQKKAVDDVNVKLQELKNDFEQAPQLFQQLHQHNTQQTQLQKEVEALNEQLLATQASLSNLQNEIRDISAIIVEYTSIDRKHLSLLGAPEMFCIEFENSKQRIESLNTELKHITSEQAKFETLQSDVGNLINIAQTLLSHTRSDTCPLCNHQHDSHDQLISKILSNNALSEHQKQLGGQRAKLESDLQQKKQYIFKAQKYIDTLKQQKLTALNITLISAQQQHAQRQQDLNGHNLVLSKIYQQQQEVIKKTKYLSQQDYIKDCRAQAIKLEELKSELDNNLRQLAQQQLELTKQIDELSVQLAGTEKFISQLYTDETRIKYTNFFAKNQIVAGQEELLLADMITDANQSVAQLREKIASNQELIAKLEGEIRVTGAFDQQQILDSLQLTSASLQTTQNNLAAFKAKLPSIGIEETELDIKAALERQSTRLADNRQSLLSKQRLLGLLKNQLESVINLVNYLQQKQRLDEAKTQLLQYEAVDQKLKNEFSEVEQQLKARIEQFFYADLINKIYAKIDPHPTFKTVKFECIFPEDAKPRLEVYLYEEENHRPIAPSLFFSAAQLNVLSLSIFLARALHVQYQQQPVKTILIDDPIHSMDSINTLATIDLLRNISQRFDRQIILSTHDENFFELLKMKIPTDVYGSKFIMIESFGKVGKST